MLRTEFRDIPEEALDSQTVGQYLVIAYRHWGGELCYDIRIASSPRHRIVCRTNTDEKNFPKRAASVGNDMVHRLEKRAGCAEQIALGLK